MFIIAIVLSIITFLQKYIVLYSKSSCFVLDMRIKSGDRKNDFCLKLRLVSVSMTPPAKLLKDEKQ
jgi:hypothetical protein